MNISKHSQPNTNAVNDSNRRREKAEQQEKPRRGFDADNDVGDPRRYDGYKHGDEADGKGDISARRW